MRVVLVLFCSFLERGVVWFAMLVRALLACLVACSAWLLANSWALPCRFAPTKHRARMMAAVFFMQPLGQIAGNVLSLIVVSISRKSGNDDLPRTVDIMWRWIIGIGVVPGVIALLFRFAIPETPRFLLDIEDDPVKAEFDATQLFGESSAASELESNMWCDSLEESNLSNRSIDERSEGGRPSWTIAPAPLTTLNSSWRLSRDDIKQYFWTEGNWRILAATSMCWLLLDFGYYGIGLTSPQFLAKTWGSLNISGPSPPWMTNDDPNANIYDMFLKTSVQALVILNTGSFAGGLLFITFASHINRVSLQKYGFLLLAALFIALGTVFITIHQEGPLAITLYVIGQMMFNFGMFFSSFWAGVPSGEICRLARCAIWRELSPGEIYRLARYFPLARYVCDARYTIC